MVRSKEDQPTQDSLPMNALLAGDLDVGTVAVQVSEICRDDTLPAPAGLQRLDLVLEAWRAAICRHAEFLLVADRSLAEGLPADDRKRIEALQRDGSLRLAPDADDALLDRAEREGACVLASALSLEMIGSRPTWAAARLFAWEVREDLVRIVQGSPREPAPFDLQFAREMGEARANGLAVPSGDAIRRRWTCGSDVPCITRQLTPYGLEALPVLRDGLPCCPGCGHPLLERGERAQDAELKLVVDDVVRLRLTLEEGRLVTFGRLILPDTADLAALAHAGGFAGLGRRHVELRLDPGGMRARPVDARHEVRMQRWEGGQGRLGRKHRLPVLERTRVGLRDHLLLTERVVLRRSGRSIAEAEERARLDMDVPWQLAKTDQ